MPTTTINIQSYVINLASYPDFNSWKACVYLYRSNGTMAADIRFVDDPGTFVDYNSINPTGCSQFHIDYKEFPVWADVLHNNNVLRLLLYSNGTPRMLLQAWKTRFLIFRSYRNIYRLPET